jgi:hypothetical protein
MFTCMRAGKPLLAMFTLANVQMKTSSILKTGQYHVESNGVSTGHRTGSTLAENSDVSAGGRGGVVIKTSVNPMHSAKRCKAHSKRTGEPCKSPAKTGWNVCRMHGAGGGAPSGKENANFKRTKELYAEIRTLNRISRETLNTIPG